MPVYMSRNGRASGLYKFRPLNKAITYNTYYRRYTIKTSHAIDIWEMAKCVVVSHIKTISAHMCAFSCLLWLASGKNSCILKMLPPWFQSEAKSCTGMCDNLPSCLHYKWNHANSNQAQTWFSLYFRHGVDSFIFHKTLYCVVWVFFVHWLVWYNSVIEIIHKC